MSNVQQLFPVDEELRQFLDFLYEEQEGYVYLATMEPETRDFIQYFFEWPKERKEILDHVKSHSPAREVYFGPAILSSPNSKKQSFRGTYCVWAEFDDSLPEDSSGVPEPTIRIRSSVEGHEHWYWKLSNFIQSSDAVENITRRIAYALDADHCWDATRLLRPPGTIHHESGNTVKIIRWDKRPVDIENFATLPDIPITPVGPDDIRIVPDVANVIMEYPFPKEAIELMRADSKTIKAPRDGKKGSRSSALTKMGHFCMEMGMSNAETLSVLLNRDNKWGKYVKRFDQRHRLIEIINYCRSKHAIDPIKESSTKEKLKVYTYEEFMAAPVEFKWLIEGLLHEKGCISISGLPNVGKTQMMLRLMEKLAKGEKFLQWKVPKPMKTLFLSLEMAHEELKQFLDVMQFTDKDEQLRDNFLILPIGHGVKFNAKGVRDDIDKMVQQFQPDGIIVDSFGRSVLNDLSSDKIILESFEYIDRTLRSDYGCWVGLVHHMRKPQIGNKKPSSLEDLFGSQYYGASISSAMNLHKLGFKIEIGCLKMRMAETFKSFYVKRTPILDFQIIGQAQSTEGPTLEEFGKLGETI